MMRLLKTYPLHLLLLPVFFVAHGYLENLGLIEVQDALVLLGYYWLLTSILFLLFYFLLRRFGEAALITTISMGVFFFFGALHDVIELRAPFPFLKRYLFQLPLLLLCLLALFLLLRKKQERQKPVHAYLNLLLLIWLAVDVFTAFINLPSAATKTPLSVYPSTLMKGQDRCTNCEKPDIYLLLYDEYTSPDLLNERYAAGNTLPAFLESRGFRVLHKSRSNYNFTPFSMASILNLSYLTGIPDVRAVTAKDYARCQGLIKHNQLIHFLDHEGYEIVNYSVFDLAGHPTLVDQSFLPLKTKLISERTLYAYIRKDLGWQWMVRFPFRYFFKNQHYQVRDNNERFQQLLKETARKRSGRPRFFYAHFYLPHPPFFYDSSGKPKSERQLLQESAERTVKAYLDYAAYANTRIAELVVSLQEQNPKAVVMIMSDHGFREPLDRNYPDFFNILNAVYLPDRDYSHYNDSLSAVNQFRVLLNKYYPGSFRPLPDSMVYLIDKK